MGLGPGISLNLYIILQGFEHTIRPSRRLQNTRRHTQRNQNLRQNKERKSKKKKVEKTYLFLFPLPLSVNVSRLKNSLLVLRLFVSTAHTRPIFAGPLSSTSHNPQPPPHGRCSLGRRERREKGVYFDFYGLLFARYAGYEACVTRTGGQRGRWD